MYYFLQLHLQVFQNEEFNFQSLILLILKRMRISQMATMVTMIGRFKPWLYHSLACVSLGKLLSLPDSVSSFINGKQ